MATPKRPKPPDPPEPPEGPPRDAFNGEHLLIAEAPCDECLFSTAKLVSARRKQAILRGCYEDGTYFVCHKATLAGRAVICHNFAKSKEGAGNQAIRVAQFFNVVRYVDPATGKPTVPRKPGKVPKKAAPKPRRR